MAKKNRRKVSGKKTLMFFVTSIIFIIVIYLLLNIKITNIYIKNNVFLSDQEIIDISGLKNYPSALSNTSSSIKKTLEKNSLIKKAKVTKKLFTSVYIEVIENTPIFYYSHDNKYVLLDGTKVDGNYNVPILINYVPDAQYLELIKRYSEVDVNIINKISEIKYDPNKEVDPNRFLLIMNDGNYVYITLNKIDNLNNYLDILKNLEGKKGILYLDSGSSFTILEN